VRRYREVIGLIRNRRAACQGGRGARASRLDAFGKGREDKRSPSWWDVWVIKKHLAGKCDYQG